MLPDTHLLGRTDAGHVLIQHDAALPWFIVVPETATTDLLDLDAPHRERLLETCAALSRYVKNDLGFPKVNVASIGNVVPRLHVHVVGRRPGDPCWPAPVWGNLATGERYAPERIAEMTAALERLIALRPA